MNKIHKKAILYCRISSEEQRVDFKPKNSSKRIMFPQNHKNIFKNIDPSDKVRRNLVAKATKLDKVVDRVIRKEYQNVVLRKIKRDSK